LDVQAVPPPIWVRDRTYFAAHGNRYDKSGASKTDSLAFSFAFGAAREYD